MTGAMKRGRDDMEAEDGIEPTVACCGCGVLIVPNSMMKCAPCLKADVDVAKDVSRSVVINHCKECNSYLNHAGRWMPAELESRELLGICLKKVKGLSKDVKLVDAAFIYTEEHSKRLKIRISVQREVANSAVLQQSLVVEFIVQGEQCPKCKKAWTPHAFQAIVQVRQKVQHRRTFFHLEQRILKDREHEKVCSISESIQGLDFMFEQRSHAQRFADYVQACVPTKQKQSRHLISHDTKCNNYHYKYTILCDLCSLCVDDLIYVPAAARNDFGGVPPLMICYKISSTIHLVDPSTLKGYDIPSIEYFKRPLESVCQRQHLTEYTVLDVTKIDAPPPAGTPARHNIGGRHKMALAEIEVARTSDLGQNDNRITVRSHLGKALRPGDKVMGYDIAGVNLSGAHTEALDDMNQDVVLVRKVYKKSKGGREWALQRLQKDRDEGWMADEDKLDKDMEDFKDDLEQDPAMRSGVNVFRDPRKADNGPATSVAANAEEDEDEDDEDRPEVPLAELLEGLRLDEAV
jgi:nonsense-mediated mRNA decay protein 3